MRLVEHPQQMLFSPTDLSTFVSCTHASSLDSALARKEIEGVLHHNPFAELLQERGLRFEKSYIEHLRSQGYQVDDLRGLEYEDGDRFSRTLVAMRRGVDIIIQGRLEMDSWGGKPDILRKVRKPCKLYEWSYEVLDTKLAMETKGGTVLQLCSYTEMLGRIQGRTPKYMYVVKPGEGHVGFTEEPFLFSDFNAYYRRVSGDLQEWVGKELDESIVPSPVDHCQFCRWWKKCNQDRRDHDHLSFVAGLQKSHLQELNDHAIDRLETLATTSISWTPGRGEIRTYERLQEQAHLQWKLRNSQELQQKWLSFEDGKGLALLPEPSPGDVFFDIEADRFLEGGGLEYLHGIAYRTEEGEIVYDKYWALSRSEEKEQFEALMDWLTARRSQYPDMHIYHFHHYETTALKRLMSRHDTMSIELDDLLRAEVFVDLHKVVKESMLLSVEQYSLKDLESFYDFKREVDLRDAGFALRATQKIIEFESPTQLPDEVMELVEGYNREDCYSTFHLRDWLEELRSLWIDKNGDLPRPHLEKKEDDKEKRGRDLKLEGLAKRLRNKLECEADKFKEVEQSAIQLMADLVSYFRREDKSTWWEFFHLSGLEPEMLFKERKAIANLEFLEIIEENPSNPLHKYRYPFQEISLKKGDRVRDLNNVDQGSIASINLKKNTIQIRRSKDTKDQHPDHVFHWQLFNNEKMEEALYDIGRQLIEDDGFKVINSCTADLLLKRKPRLKTFTNLEKHDGEESIARCQRLVKDLDNSILPIQGPPGTGKSHTAAHMILALVQQNKRIGVSAVSHKVIEGLLCKTVSEGQKKKITVETMHQASKKKKEAPGYTRISNKKKVLAALNDHKVVGGTAFYWSRPEAIQTLDYLFVDEAGQMSMAQVLALSRATKNLVLVGDPSQLEQPQQASHPDGADISALDYLLDGHDTLPRDKGIFLDVTWRMHPQITDFISNLFYEDRLHTKPGLENQELIGADLLKSPLTFLPVPHSGNQSSSHEEAIEIQRLVDNLTNGHVTWVDEEKVPHTVSNEDILIITPYNAQVALLSQYVADVEIGTVDKFQGKEAPVVIFSMGSSSATEAPRGMRFLYHPNRLNVAVSRARCSFILVGSPTIFDAPCQTPDQMRWANVYCRFLEEVDEVKYNFMEV